MHTQLFLQDDFADEGFWAVRPKSLHTDIKHSLYELIRAPLAPALPFLSYYIITSAARAGGEKRRKKHKKEEKHALIIHAEIQVGLRKYANLEYCFSVSVN